MKFKVSVAQVERRDTNAAWKAKQADAGRPPDPLRPPISSRIVWIVQSGLEMKSIVYLWTFGSLVLAATAAQALEGSFTYEGLANCRQPAVTNYPLRGSGTAELKEDRTAALSTEDS